MDDIDDVENLNPLREIQPINGREDDRDRAIKDYTMLTPQVIYPRIVRPKVQAANFELKPVMFQIYKQWGNLNGLSSEDPHLHLKQILEMETFYNGLNPSTRLIVDVSTNGALLSKSYNEAYGILERIENNNYQWPSTRQDVIRFCYEKYKEFVQVGIDIDHTIAERKLHLVYGGGDRGLSKLISKAVFVRGSQVLCIIPKALKPLGCLSNPPTGEELVVSTKKLFICAPTTNELLDLLQAKKPEPNLMTLRLDWATDDDASNP
ncbi:hypothetical protein WN944_010561 [Citrus x changshan-huyou]|uniref:Uncharacterized protein n=1 Tax=Citrus x changshan-huyou TaxID=2935761 RepID=A0AAP0MTX6_9ROSI